MEQSAPPKFNLVNFYLRFSGRINLAGPIWAIVELGFLQGTPEENRYGPVP